MHEFQMSQNQFHTSSICGGGLCIQHALKHQDNMAGKNNSTLNFQSSLYLILGISNTENIVMP